MDRWEELVLDYERAIADRRTMRAARLLAEFTLTAPAGSVRRFHRRLVEASAACTVGQAREQFVTTLELLRQRATLTESSLSLISSERPEDRAVGATARTGPGATA